MKVSRKFRNVLRLFLPSVLLGLLCLVLIETLVHVSNTMVRPPMEGMENQVTDLAFHVRRLNSNHQRITPEQIVIIDIDDASINILGRAQLWPRAYDARVINYIASGNPAAIGIDFLYTETDSLSPEYANILQGKGFQNAEQITKALSTDELLIEAVHHAGNVYLSFFDDDAHISSDDQVEYDASRLRTFSFGNDHSYNFFKIIHPVLPFTDLAAEAKGIGSITVPTMQDGTVRHYVLGASLVTALPVKERVPAVAPSALSRTATNFLLYGLMH